MGNKKKDPEVTEEATLDETPEVESGETLDETPEVFDKEYVQKLRDENARYRTRANEVSQRLHTELVRANGRLADPTDLPFDEEHLADPEKLTAAIDSLIESKPHLKSRQVQGDIAQGKRGENAEEADFMGFVRGLM